MSINETDRRIASIAEQQYGVFHRSQAFAAGGTPQMIDTRVNSGRWIRLCPEVFRIGGVPPTFRGDLRAACFANPGGAISGLAGAGLHELVGFGTHPPELTLTGSGGHQGSLATIRRRSEYRKTRRLGMPVGTIDQILADIAGHVPQQALASALDAALLGQLVPLGRLEDQVARMTRVRERGVGDLRALVRERSSTSMIPQSVLEQSMLKLLRSPGIPEFTFQCPVPWVPEGSGYFDAFVPAWLLVVEADGRRWHSSPADFANDRRRDKLSLGRGIATARFTHTELTVGFDESLALLRAIGAERARLLGHK